MLTVLYTVEFENSPNAVKDGKRAVEPIEEREHDYWCSDATVAAVELNETVLLQGLVELGPQHKEVDEHRQLHQAIQYTLDRNTFYEYTELLFYFVFISIAYRKHYVEVNVRKCRRNNNYNTECAIDALTVSLQTADSFRAGSTLEGHYDRNRACDED